MQEVIGLNESIPNLLDFGSRFLIRSSSAIAPPIPALGSASRAILLLANAIPFHLRDPPVAMGQFTATAFRYRAIGNLVSAQLGEFPTNDFCVWNRNIKSADRAREEIGRPFRAVESVSAP